ncbi:MAG: glycosyltransferase [Propionibacteriaceae bacterium]|jgi:GT2 family glycosyltransferase|nr:glycosyltransferase [Propionibacteriaceae bacterium]
MKLLISVATFKRPAMLRRLLMSLFSGGIGHNEVDVVVVDNDPQRSAAGTAGLFTSVTYVYEPQPGIPAARNRALDEFKADYFAMVFVDDDEWVSPGWLDALLAAQEETQAGVVYGLVKTEGGDDRAAAIQRTERPHLSKLKTAAANNTLLTYAAWTQAGQPRFDPAFAALGGEDSDFFFGLHQAGTKIVSTSEAVVFEDLPLERASFIWFAKRYLRQGQANYLLARKYQLNRVKWTLRTLAEIPACAVMLLGDVLRRRGKSSPWLRRGLFALGKLSALGGIRIRGYRS